jgi:hypothetical protein
MASEEVEKQVAQGLAPKEREGKLVWRNLPLKELEEVCKVFNHGTIKYKAPFTYRIGGGLPDGDMFDANMRHLERIQAGELRAMDSGCLHWAHIAADSLMEISRILIEEERNSKQKVDNASTHNFFINTIIGIWRRIRGTHK